MVASSTGPAITSSRWVEPTRKRWMSPVATPTDIDSLSRPKAVFSSAARRSSRCMAVAVAAARGAWSGPWNRKSSASPPNLSRPPPRPAATSRMAPNTRLSVSTSSSAPRRPRLSRRSDSAVKPDTSAKHNVPSTMRDRASGASAIQDSAISGTWRRRRAYSLEVVPGARAVADLHLAARCPSLPASMSARHHHQAPGSPVQVTPARRSAASTVLRNSIAIVVGPTPPTRGVIQPATSSQRSSTSGRRRRPS